MRSNMVWKSKAPPSLNVSFSSTAGCSGGILPPGTAWTMPVHTLGPKKGAATCVSWRLSIGAAKDWRAGDDVPGRYTSFAGRQPSSTPFGVMMHTLRFVRYAVPAELCNSNGCLPGYLLTLWIDSAVRAGEVYRRCSPGRGVKVSPSSITQLLASTHFSCAFACVEEKVMQGLHARSEVACQ